MGERTYGEMYSQVMDASELAYQTLANYKWVSSKVEFSRRQENLSYSHHAEVVSLTPDLQSYWLDIAADEDLSTLALRGRIELAKGRHFELDMSSLVMSDAPTSTQSSARRIFTDWRQLGKC